MVKSTVAPRPPKPRPVPKSSTAKGMTIDEILKRCPPRIAVGASSSVIKTVKPVMTKDGRQRVELKMTTRETLQGERKPPPPIVPHKVIIEALEPNMSLRGRDTRVKVSCDCGDFWSTWEVALHKKGSADIIFSNGDPPLTKNPRMIPGCCKHLYAAFAQIRGRKV